MFDGQFRSGVDRWTTPIGRAISSVGVTADLLTLSGLVFGLATAVAIASGHTMLGFVGVLATGVPDLLDGPVAKASGLVSKRGAFFDSFVDRVNDLLLFGGIGLLMHRNGHDFLALVSFASYGLASLISYQRAKAESLGFDAKGGIMERAERVIAVALGLLLSALLGPILVLIFLLTFVTVVQRFLKVWGQGSTEMPERAVTSRTAYLQLRRQEQKRRIQGRRSTGTTRRTSIGPVTGRPIRSVRRHDHQTRQRAAIRMRSWWENQR